MSEFNLQLRITLRSGIIWTLSALGGRPIIKPFASLAGNNVMSTTLFRHFCDRIAVSEAEQILIEVLSFGTRMSETHDCYQLLKPVCWSWPTKVGSTVAVWSGPIQLLEYHMVRALCRFEYAALVAPLTHGTRRLWSVVHVSGVQRLNSPQVLI